VSECTVQTVLKETSSFSLVNAKRGQLGPEFDDILEAEYNEVHGHVNAKVSLGFVL
jgi:hypothetical protein